MEAYQRMEELNQSMEMDLDHPSPPTLTPLQYNFSSPPQMYPITKDKELQPTDVTIVSSDSVCFDVHFSELSAASSNGFNGFLSNVPPAPDKALPNLVLTIPETSVVVAIVLHTIYGVDCSHHSPSFEDLVAAVHAMKTYGLPLQTCFSPSAPLFNTMIAHAPCNALALYTLASANNLHSLASYTSSHLLSLRLSALPDEITAQLNPVHLKRLFLLHMDRVAAFKQLLITPPVHHEPIASCTSLQQQERITGTWNHITAYLSFNARPDTSTATIEATLHGVQLRLPCALCRQAIKDRLQMLIIQWSTVKQATI